MAISWGSWEGSGYNRIRVGIEVENWTAGDGSAGPNHNDTQAQCKVKFYVDVEGNWSDSQTLNFGGAFGGSMNFTNNQDNSQALRETKTFEYNYGNNEYGSSPGKRTFSVSLSGAYNGATPSKSVTVSIPARPYAAPTAPNNVSVSRVNDGSQRISWNNRATSGEPYDRLRIQRDVVANDVWNGDVTTTGGGAESTTDNETGANQKYRYRVRAENSAGDSSYVETGVVYTSPAAPTGATRTPGTGAQQVVSWTNQAGYDEYETEVWVSRDGVWSLLTTRGAGITSHTDTAASAAQPTKYRVRHKTTTGVQGTLYSSYSAETSETAGVTTPPLVPTDLVPDGLTVDPTLAIRLAWAFQPGQAGDTQQAYRVKHRIAGATSWTIVEATSSNQFYDIPRDTYDEQTIVEWTVETKGADPLWSPEANTVSFTTGIAAIAPDPVKLPVLMDLFTGQLEASSTAYEIRSLVQRIQSNLMGGGVRSVDSSYNISWSQRFITISLGNSERTFKRGHHDIVSPFGWSVTQKAITSNRVTLTMSVGTNTNRARVGDTITVSGVGAPYDGTHIVRETTTTQVKYDVNPTANVATTASGGAVFCTIRGHGGATDSVPSAAKVPLQSWWALYYELPLGWGAGTTPRKNGVVRVTSASLTSNVATFTVPAPHYFAMGDRVDITGCGAPFDGEVTVTGVSGSTIQANITSANVGAFAPASGRAAPSGKDTFFSNFHVVDYHDEFVVPDNWILIAMRNGDGATVEWGTGDTVDPGFDSDSPVFRQAIFTSTTDASDTAGNKPPLRIGDINGNHMRIDGNEIISMNNDSTRGDLFLNKDGGSVYIGMNGGGKSYVRGSLQVDNDLDVPNMPTGNFTANVNLNATNGRFRRDTSSARYKENITPADLDVERLLALEPQWFQRNDDRDDDGNPIPFDPMTSPVYVGFIAEHAHELGLENWVTWDGDQIDGFAYDKWVIALQAIVRGQQSRLDSLEQRLAALEGQVD